MSTRTCAAGSALAGLTALLLAGCASGPAPVKPTSGDLERLRAAEQQALEDARTGQAVNWDNPKTGHRGSVTVLETKTVDQTDDGQPCRLIQRVFSADETTRTGTAYACRTRDGDWTVEREESLLTRDQRLEARRRALPYWPGWYGHPARHRDPSHSGVNVGVGVSGGF